MSGGRAAMLANLKPPWQPGVSANPGGKPVATRNRINAKFLNALEKDFDEGGAEAIEKCRTEDPPAYVRALLYLLPKELEITTSPFAELTDEQLESIFAACGAILAAQSDRPGDSAASGEQSPAGLLPLCEAG